MPDNVRQIALYGKGSIGKSTIACNVSIALTEMGRKVLQVGCSPKGDSTAFLLGGDVIEHDILGFSRETRVNADNIMECVVKGYKGIYCAESGGPEPAVGCAGRGVALALDYLSKFQVSQRLDRDFMVYDCIADVTCGGFGEPLRHGYAQEVYLVTSGEVMSLYSSNNICIACADVAKSGGNVRVGGIIVNMRGVENEESMMREFAQMLGVPVMGFIPRSPIVQQAEAEGSTVLAQFPHSDLANLYRKLAKDILDQKERHIPTPIKLDDILELSRKYQAFDMVA